MEHPWHTISAAAAVKLLSTSESGLTNEEAARRLQENGPNSLPQAEVDSLGRIFFRQFQSPLIYVLFVASAIVLALGELIDGGIILAVLLFNAVVGAFQEGRAQNTLLALKKFVETEATVYREGKEMLIPDTAVVPGDVLILQEGQKVAADARIFVSHNLTTDEAALTGESGPVHKIAEALAGADFPTAEQKNMVIKGTHVVAGNGRAVVVATGAQTVLGKISREIAAIDTEIPLTANIRYLSRIIIAVVGGLCGLLFFVGIAVGRPVKEMFTTVVSLSVSIIPEGLPIVLTLVLAAGVWRMSKRQALIKKLQAVEALGQARVIAVDKTGTITKNELVIQTVYAGNTFFAVGGLGYEPKGEILQDGVRIDPPNHPELLFAGKIAALCAKARVLFSAETQEWRVIGDPTEAAMLVCAEKIGFHKDDLERELPELAEIPFDYTTKYHATLRQVDGKDLVAVVGAPEAVLQLCSLTPAARAKIEAAFGHISKGGMRVVALAAGHEKPEPFVSGKIRDLAFVGFLGMKDTLRPEVEGAMAKATAAGIRVVMITGDHKITAQAIATEAGIYHEGDGVLTGQEIDALSDRALAKKIPAVTVFARVTPEHKLRIIEAYKRAGQIVAMTGDGVNDAPSLVAADLGVAMGKIGTEVAKEAADIVLLDDNFGSIVSAVEEGRNIYKSIKKVILYLFSTSIGEAGTIMAALFMGLPLPILPAQIIWLNFVTDSFLDVALAMEPKEVGLLQGNFERPKKYLVDRLMGYRMAAMALPMMVGTLYLFSQYYETNPAKAWTVSLTTLAVFQWFNAWNCRSERLSIFQMNPLANKFLLAATAVVVALQLFAVYSPFAHTFLHTAPLALSEWGMIIAVAASIVVVEEVRKWFYRRAGVKPYSVVH